ncbi:hypothetical protein J5N97_023958 [Dioscorea zingiberensis]|uniref:Bifunctional inhibitor/plant lipid transfer protein/seed storage helical domain-containing protein n=1 Tax=Dioscorea zingiberensis TaxID=325984 RepID=A0A9D5C5T5_9LILI|nr:hypothetical protein J5N97_023958 [Dioscorea zingiberensis]
MASKATAPAVTLFLILNLLIFNLGTSWSPPPSSSKGKCPMDALKLAVCADVLNGLLNITIGNPPKKPCCPLIENLLDLEAAVCLCTAIKADLLGIHLNIPLDLSLVLNYCGKKSSSIVATFSQLHDLDPIPSPMASATDELHDDRAAFESDASDETDSEDSSFNPLPPPLATDDGDTAAEPPNPNPNAGSDPQIGDMDTSSPERKRCRISELGEIRTPAGFDDSRRLFQRLFSDEDEITILNGFLETMSTIMND